MQAILTLVTSLLVSLSVVTPAIAATENFEASRPLKGERRLDVEITLGTGEFRLEPGSFNKLYEVGVTYSADHLAPRVRYVDGVLALSTMARKKLTLPGTNRWTLSLNQKMPMALHADLGATKSDLDLTGLRLEECSILMGTGLAELKVSTPNPVRMRRMYIEAGAASIKATGLGNANVERFEFEGGVGNSELDFGGDWRLPGKAKVKTTIGRLVISVPRSIGLRVKAPQGWISRVNMPAELKADKDGWRTSPNFAASPGKLEVEAEAAVGTIDIKWE